MSSTESTVEARGLKFTRRFAEDFSRIEWEERTSVVKERDGTVVFEMKDVRVPSSWSQAATDILASKYFRKAEVPPRDWRTRDAILDDYVALAEHGGWFNDTREALEALASDKGAGK